LCGRGVAARVILSGEPIEAKLAHSLGMVDWVFPRATLEQETRAIVERLEHLPAHAQSAAKRCIAAAADPEAGFRLERELGGALLESARTQALITAFLQRNAART
jgi:enoyl-CoA hydratase/carnithine racemase